MSSPSSLFSETSTSTSSDVEPNSQDNGERTTLSEQDERAAPAWEVHDGLAYKVDDSEELFHGASRAAPPIPGLYVFPGLLPVDTAREHVSFDWLRYFLCPPHVSDRIAARHTT